MFYSKGKPSVLVKCDRDYCLVQVRGGKQKASRNKLSVTNLQLELFLTTRERKKNVNSVFSEIYKKQIQLEAIQKLNLIMKNSQSFKAMQLEDYPK